MPSQAVDARDACTTAPSPVEDHCGSGSAPLGQAWGWQADTTLPLASVCRGAVGRRPLFTLLALVRHIQRRELLPRAVQPQGALGGAVGAAGPGAL